MSATSGFGQYLEDAAINWFRGVAYPATPANIFLALFTTAPVNGTDSAAVEVTGGSYARVSLTPSTSLFSAPSGSGPATSSNNASVPFTTPTGSWGTVTGWALYDAGTAGHMLAYGSFAATPINTGDAVNFLTNQLVLSVS